MKERDGSFDFLKCVFIILMVMFHLAGFADRHPLLKSFVYTFHMPGFLLLSGWLVSVHKPVAAFLRRIAWIFVPYALVETAYVVAASFLPVREEAGELTPVSLLGRLLWNPLGPYWYLHTWMVCQLLCFSLSRWMRRVSLGGRLCVAACLVYAFSLVCPVFGWANGFYFLAGWGLREAGVPLQKVFPATGWTVLPLVWLAASPGVFDKASVGGMALVCCVVSLLFRLYACPVVRRFRAALFVGRNTLPILLFSPVFTLAVKPLDSWLSFDGSGLAFMLVGTVSAVGGPLALAWMADRLSLSRWLFGRLRVLQ